MGAGHTGSADRTGDWVAAWVVRGGGLPLSRKEARRGIRNRARVSKGMTRAIYR
jgi:hypothetical protein